MMPRRAFRDPIPLAPNPIPRFYRGSGALRAFRGAAVTPGEVAASAPPPEDWVGSVTRVWQPPGSATSEFGLSAVREAGSDRLLADLVAEHPLELIGEAMLRAGGPTSGLLVKLLDAGERLPVHGHPTRELAARLLGSRFGKTEAWIILEAARDARIWLGFRDEVPAATLRGWIDEQRSDALLDALAAHPVAAGEVWLVPAGTPHAIGAGIFLVELQEPSDFSIVAEWRGFPIDPEEASLGLGWDAMLDAFDRHPAGELRQRPERLPPAGDGSEVTRLTGAAADPYFRALRMRVDGRARLPVADTFAVVVVTDGAGEAIGAGSSLPIARGSTFAVPAAAADELRLAAEEPLELIVCLGPDPAQLELPPLP